LEEEDKPDVAAVPVPVAARAPLPVVVAVAVAAPVGVASVVESPDPEINIVPAQTLSGRVAFMSKSVL
jgi:hypothetical protein